MNFDKLGRSTVFNDRGSDDPIDDFDYLVG